MKVIDLLRCEIRVKFKRSEIDNTHYVYVEQYLCVFNDLQDTWIETHVGHVINDVTYISISFILISTTALIVYSAF